MTAYNVVNRAALQSGQPEDISQVLANLDAIAAILNGNLDDFNLKAGANIAIAKLLAGANGQILQTVAGAAAWGLKITTSTIAGGPPGAPANGDIWIATDVDANGVRWAFQYNANSASVYKWEFIGGPPVRAYVLTYESVGATGAWVNLPTNGPLYTTVRAGDYMAMATSQVTIGSVASTPNMAVTIGDTVPGSIAAVTQNVGWTAILHKDGLLFAGVAAAAAIKMRYNSGYAGDSFGDRFLTVTPVRVS